MTKQPKQDRKHGHWYEPAHLEAAAHHAGITTLQLLQALSHLAASAAPVAAAVGVATGQPEVVAAAKIAEVVAPAAEAALDKAVADATDDTPAQ